MSQQFACSSCACRASLAALRNYYMDQPAVTRKDVNAELLADVPYAECIQADCDGHFDSVDAKPAMTVIDGEQPR